ncbi:MAG: hypothetical protein M1370_03450 [Bacteroidetes bacterium]|nr:hypothetical protein [Bacteroidota bacterium]
MKERTILADCCEDWILQYGQFYLQGEGFSCPECATAWQKLAPPASEGSHRASRYRRVGDGRTFAERARTNEGAEFCYLSAEDGTEPLVERCCAQVLLRYGERTPLAEFRCPVCHTHWTRTRASRGGVEITCFRKDDLDEPFAIQPGAARNFLVPLTSYRLPRD